MPPPAKNLAPVAQFQADEFVLDLAIHPGGEWLAAACADGTVFLLSMSGAVCTRLSADDFSADTVAFSPDGHWLATGGQGGRLRVWDVDALASRDSGRDERTAAAKAPTPVAERILKGWIRRVAFAPATAKVAKTGSRTADDPVLLAAAADKSVFVGDARLRPLWSIAPLAHTVNDLAWHPRGGELLVARHGGVERWAAPTASPSTSVDTDVTPLATQKTPLELSGVTPLRLALDGPGRWVVAGLRENGLHLWRLVGRGEAEMPGYPGKVENLVFDAEGRFLATGGGSEVVVWDFSGRGPEGTQPRVLPGMSAAVSALAFHPKDRLLAVGGADGEVGFLRLSGRGERDVWAALARKPDSGAGAAAAVGAGSAHGPGAVTRLAFAPNGSTLVSGHADGCISMWTSP